jgi:hypothetical protein
VARGVRPHSSKDLAHEDKEASFDMNLAALVIGLIVLVAIVAVAVWAISQQRRRARLREQFGPEYDHAVETYGERREAEQALTARTERVASLHIRPLSPEQSTRYADAWRTVQTRFVDDPENAIRDADQLCGDVMEARGYPVGDFEQRAADVSVDHPRVVENYRAAHAVAVASARGEASTEHLRQAMVHYRILFEDLIETRQTAHVES